MSDTSTGGMNRRSFLSAAALMSTVSACGGLQQLLADYGSWYLVVRTK
ncbi:hypothetical protein [Nonomuraea turcica]|nr:hypothetical protein [Nonomuraea sp. G32]MDP4501662.1 hypothetical protein [Nonomuraea sp. G32]